MQQDEVYLIDIGRLLSRQRAWFLAVFIVVVALAAAYLSVVRRQWQVDAWVQIGQVASAPVGQDPKVESLLRVMERLKTDAFRDEVLTTIGIPLKAPAAKLYRASMTLDPEPYANLVRITLRAYSPSDARQLAIATVDHLRAIHKVLGEAPLAAAQARLAELNANLATAQADRDRLRQQLNAGRGDAAVTTLSLAATEQGVRDLQQAQSELRSRLTRNYTFETSMPWPVDVTDDPVKPMVPLVIGVGVLGGLGLGALVAIAIDARQRSTRRRGKGTHGGTGIPGGERHARTKQHPDAVDAA